MRTLSAGPYEVRIPGQTVDVSEAEARELIAGKYADAVDVPAAIVAPAESSSVEPETATAAVHEVATLPKSRGRARR